MEVNKLGFKEARKLVSKIAELKNRLQKLGVIIGEGKITDGYVEWFCSKKFDLELCPEREFGYNAVSKSGERVQILCRIGSDIDFKVTFDGIRINELDYLLVVFIDEKTWVIDSVYRVPHKVVKEFLSVNSANRFEWRRESRSLSLQVYPSENNMIVL